MQVGWAKVLPFNDNLIFLKGEHGEYDFVFRNLRNDKSPLPAFSKGLSIGDVPDSFWQNDLFPFKYYYSEDQWDRMLRHEAEIKYYDDGGQRTDYPGLDEVLKNYLQWPRNASKALRNDSTLSGFRPVNTLDGNRLHVQVNPVTIGEFKRFMNDSDYGYNQRRYSDLECPWEPANLDSPGLPACVTYYDALAYANWLGKRHNIPFRLLRIEEYKEIHPYSEIAGDKDVQKENSGIDFRLPDGTSVNVFERMPSETWTQVEAHFKEELHWRTGSDDVQFLMSRDCGEWLFEHRGTDAAAIRTKNLRGIRGGHNVIRDFHPMASWGKYKGCKIGFRLCFEVDK